MKQRQRAFTLIEVLVALVIMAVLGLMSWRAISASLDSRDQILEFERRWQRVSRALSTVETNLMQIADRGNPAPDALPDFQLTLSSTGEQRLILLRMDTEQGARLSGFEWKGSSLALLRWPGRVASPEFKSEPLLEGISNLRWFAYDNKGTPDISDDEWLEKWSNRKAPAGLKLVMDVASIGSIERLYAIH